MRIWTALAGCLALSCSDKGRPLVQDGCAPALPEATPFSDCDPLQEGACGYPFPSDFYTVADSSTPTGLRVNLGPTTMPANTRGTHGDPTYLNQRDGWTLGGPMMAWLPTATVEGVAGHDDIGRSLDDDSPTIVIDLETGERVAHWVERDVRLGESEDAVLLIRPAAPLDFNRRYVVGIRGLVQADGSAVPSPAAFETLRSGALSGDPDLDQRLGWYCERIFPALEGQGWTQDEVILAWDFTTASREGVTRQALTARDLALDATSGGLSYTIDSIEEAPNDDTAFRLEGTFTAPLLATEDNPGAVLTRDEDGLPFINGETEVPFTVIVPNSLVEEARPGALLQYGHGLLGSRGEVKSGYLAEMANRYGWVVFAVDWTGMSGDDAIAIALAVQEDIGSVAMVPERSVQGFVEFELSMQLMMNELAEDPQMQVTDADGRAVSLIDPSRRYYYGNSQGGILGAAYTGLSTQVQRSVLGVPGGPYSLLLTRSTGFDTFLTIFQLNWPDPKDISLLIGLMQVLWDSAEPTGYLTSTNRDPLPGTPEKDVLLHVARADQQVTHMGGHFMARGYDAKLVDEPAHEVWGIETVPDGHAGSALVEFEYGIEVPYVNVPPPGPDPHEWPRRDELAQEQIRVFFETGEVVNFCEGPCGDPERGASD